MTRRPLHRPWSVDDDATLLTMVRQGKSAGMISVRLRRTPKAVEARRKLLLGGLDADGGEKKLASRTRSEIKSRAAKIDDSSPR
jgi:hypothetical protein